MSEVRLSFTQEEARRAATAPMPMPSVVGQQGALADAFARRQRTPTASRTTAETCVSCSAAPRVGVPRVVEEHTATYFASSCPYPPPLYPSPSNPAGPAEYTWIDTLGCQDGEDCSTSSHPCCYPTDAHCQDKLCAWTPIDPPPLDNPWVLHERTALFIAVEGFTCPAHIDLVRAALWLLNRSAWNGDFWDWLLCTFEASDAVQAGNIDKDRLRSLIGGPFVTVSTTTLGVEYLRIVVDNSDPNMSVAGTVGGAGQLEPTVQIRTEHLLFKTMAGAWNHGTDDEKICAALRLSAAIGHELLHIAGAANTLDGPGGAYEDRCSHWNIYMNSYLWALGMRLQWVGGAGAVCCSLLDSAYYFYSDCSPDHFFIDRLPGVTLSPGFCVAAAFEGPVWDHNGPLYYPSLPLNEAEWLCPVQPSLAIPLQPAP